MLSRFLHYSFIKCQLQSNPAQLGAVSCKFQSKRHGPCLEVCVCKSQKSEQTPGAGATGRLGESSSLRGGEVLRQVL